MAQIAARETPFHAFHQRLKDLTKRPTPSKDKYGREWHGQEFVLYDDLCNWLAGPSATLAATNVDMLLSAASKSDWPDLRGDQVTTGDSACLLVFCILIELNQADLIRDFYTNNIVDRQLPIALHDLGKRIFRIAKHRNIRDSDRWAQELAYNFDQKQWKYRPVKFMYEDTKIWNEKQVFPFMEKYLITDKGGTSCVYEVTVPSCLVDERLHERIRKNDVLVDSVPCCHFALKVFKDGHKHIFEDETEAYRVLSRSSGENSGMLSYLGRFSSIDDSKEQHNILLEYANNDLEGNFRRSPPFLPDTILQFWKDLTPVVSALSQLHDFEIGNSIKPAQKYEGWHADIKPDNILRVNHQFKLADPGFAKFQKKQPGDAPHMDQTRFTGGTATFGAPERFSNGKKKADPRSSDMWSIGCVLSESATWMALGNLGVRTFRDIRFNAISKLMNAGRTKFSVSLEGINGSDFFHDGEEVLPEVTQWHALLRTLLRPTDYVTRRILELVDEHLFLPNPWHRRSAKDTYAALNRYIQKAEQSRAGPSATISNAIRTAIENAGRQESEELQVYVDSQSNEEKQAEKENPPYLQIRGPHVSGVASVTARRSSFDGMQSFGTTATQAISQSSPTRSVSTQHRLRSSIGEDSRSHGVIPGNSAALTRADTSVPPPSKETVFDTYYLTTQQKTKQMFGLRTSKRSPPRDERLRKQVRERDLVFLIDNGQSMLEHWHEATFVLEMLYNKCTKLDEDGIDLHFTGGNEKVLNAKGKEGFSKIHAMMLESSGSKPTEACDTDMARPLTTLLNVWLDEYKRKRAKQKSLTIIILTDGKWIGNRLHPDAVDQAIIRFDGQLREGRVGLTPERSVSIQFVSFGNDPDALHRLSRLDNDLKYKGVADIVDTEPSRGDIYKMILGSIDETMDAINDPLPQPLVTSPPQSPQSLVQTWSPESAGSSYDTGRHHAPRNSGSSIDAAYRTRPEFPHELQRTLFDR